MAAGPIGVALATWRQRRALSRDALAERAGRPAGWLADVETGREWVDRRGPLAALAGALRLDIGDLTGQPYPPGTPEHAAVQAVAFGVRRALAGAPARARRAPGLVDELEGRLTDAEAREAAGDEHALALLLPALIGAADRAAGSAPRADRPRVADLRARGHATAAGLLRRLGYRDLAWILLRRVHPAHGGGPVLAEEIRLLLDMGLPEYALARARRAEPGGERAALSLLEASAHAMAGRAGTAGRLFDTALRRAGSPGLRAAAGAARALAAVESGCFEVVAEYADGLDVRELTPAILVPLLVARATTAARRAEPGTAVALLEQAETAAPLRFRLDPVARELLVVLPAHLHDPEVAGRLRAAAGRAGLR